MSHQNPSAQPPRILSQRAFRFLLREARHGTSGARNALEELAELGYAEIIQKLPDGHGRYKLHYRFTAEGFALIEQHCREQRPTRSSNR